MSAYRSSRAGGLTFQRQQAEPVPAWMRSGQFALMRARQPMLAYRFV
jgi:hypothetical protein